MGVTGLVSNSILLGQRFCEGSDVSNERTRRIGVVSLVQLQPNGLIVDLPGPVPTKSFYDAGRRVEVNSIGLVE